MVLFSFAWVFVFYLFWRSAAGGGGSGGVWAVLLGLVVSLFQYLAGFFVYAGAFGFLRWTSSFVDLIVFPVLLPFGLCFLFLVFNFFSGSLNIANFLLLWLIPCSVFRALALDAYPPPLEAVFVPLMWTSLAVGIPFFIGMSQELYGFRSVLAAAACVLLPFSGVTAYWAFFVQRLVLAWFLTVLTALPMLSTMAASFIQVKKRG